MQVFTTGEVARICEMAPRTICKLVDHGFLSGFRVPGSKDRRIPKASLLKFMREHSLSTEILEREYTLLIVIASTDESVLSLKTHAPVRDAKIECVRSVFELGCAVENKGLSCLVMDFAAPIAGLIQLHARIASDPSFMAVKKVALLPAQNNGFPNRSYFNLSFQKPFDNELLYHQIVSLYRWKLD